jgi:hypothetical protein
VAEQGAPSKEALERLADPTKLVIDVRNGIVQVSPKSRILPGTEKQRDVEAILGPADVSNTSVSPMYNIFYYDKLGICYATYKGTGIVVYFDLYLADPDEFGPKAPFPGTLTFNGNRVTARTTKADFAKLATKVWEHSVGYTVEFGNRNVSVDLVKGTNTIRSLRFME